MRRPTMVLLITACVFALAVIVVLPGVLAPAQADTSTQPGVQIIGTRPAVAPRLQLATPTPALRPPRLRLPTPPPVIRRPPVNLYPRWNRRFIVPTPEPQPNVASCGDTLQELAWTRITAAPADTDGCLVTILGAPGSSISFSLNPVMEGLALQVQLVNREGEELFSGETSSPENPVVVTYTVPPSGEVTLAVYAANEGEFEIAPQRLYYFVMTAQCGGPLTAGVERAGMVQAGGDECWYKYDGQAGHLLTVWMTTDSAELDPLLKLYDSAGAYLATADDSGGSKNAQLEYALPASEEFTIIARDYGRAAGGPFLIQAVDEFAPPTPTPRPTPFPTVSAAGCGGVVRMGTPVAGQLTTATQKCVYTYSGTAGQAMKITLVKTSGNLDTFLELYGASYPSGSRLAYNDDNSAVGGYNSQIDSYRLGSSGTYKVVVSSYGGRSTGAYRLTVAQP